jgi:FkbM family methyltransferase
VGANVGLFAFAAAYHAGPSGRVLAVEPDAWLAGLLQRSAELPARNHAPVAVLPAAVAQVVGLAELRIAARGRAANYLQGSAPSSQAGGSRAAQATVTVTLDWLLDHWGSPAVLKLDVEGAEVSALSGGRRLLAEARPTILCEVAAPNSGAVGEILRGYDYACFDAAAPRCGPLAEPPWNTLAVPAERAGAALGRR